MNLNSIVNLKNKKEDNKNKDKNKDEEKKDKIENEIILINENDMPYIDKYIYNIYDLMYIYNYLKGFGTEGCEYLVKYEIVQEILVHHYFSKKKYGDLSNINNLNNNSENDANSVEIKESNNNSITFLKSSKSLINILNEENNGIPKIVLFLSNINYINCLNKFSEYDNKYININNLFTCLILLGSELITSEKFFELINEQQLLLGDKNEKKERNKNMKHILLNKEEFLKINFWFENDKYLNNYYDSKEEELCKNDNNKIQKIKNCIFQINEEEEKIDLNKIVVLLDKFNGKEIENEEKNIINKNEETNININTSSNNNIDEEKKEEKDITKSKNDIDKKKVENIIQEKEENNKNNEENDIKKEEEKKEDKIEEKENLENKDEKSENEEDDNENNSDKESNKNDESTSNQNESEIYKNTVKNKKKGNKKDEIINNIFNAIFIQ